MASELSSVIPAMGSFTVMCVSTYCRPSELLSLRRCDLVAPAIGVLKWWTLLLFPEEAGRASKTQNFNDSIELDDERIPFLEPVRREMSHPGSLERAWPFNYPDYVEAFKRAAARLKWPTACPYQMRHSGPSIDLADRRRRMEEAQRRGRWAQPRSMMRYEPRARLAAEWAKVPAATRAHCEDCAARLAELILGRYQQSSVSTTRR